MMTRYCVALVLLFLFQAKTEGSVALLSSQEQDAILSKAQDYLDHLKTLSAKVEQKNPDNTEANGQLFLKRPGQMRLVYTSPQPLLILANKGKIFYRENDQDALYDVASTPADLLLRTSLDLKKDVHVSGISRVGNNIALTLCRPGEEGGAALTLIFEDAKSAEGTLSFKLSGWSVRDMQGNQTHVRLTDVKLGIELNNDLFVWK